LEESLGLLGIVLAVVDALPNLTVAQQNWPQLLRDALAKLSPEEAGVR
jgi:hypothetical protein